MPGPPKLLRQKALPIDEIAVPEKTTITREQVALGLKIIREGGKSPSSKLPKKTVKEHWLHLQKRRKGDQDLSNVDTYLKHRIDKAKEKSKKKKKTDTSSLSAMSIESEESVKPEVATESTWWGKTGLRDVEDDDHLYLVSHGMLGGPKIGNWGDTRDQYSPDEIADRLVAAELPKTHRIVKLFACWSAVSVEPLDPDTVKDDDRPFAERLAGALLARGYLDIEVHGFAGTVSAPIDKISKKSSGERYVSFAERLSEEEYEKLHGLALAQAQLLGFEKIWPSTELNYLSYKNPDDFISAYGFAVYGSQVGKKFSGTGKLGGWDYRGVYITDDKGVPWVVVIPFPPGPIAHALNIT
ncbi:MAG: hypothetical protein R3A51_19155 [Nannocystaceae bacterium]|nr:hypothetical protein [Myxococcales bacterium]